MQNQICAITEMGVMAGKALLAMMEFYGADHTSVNHAHVVCSIAQAIGYHERLAPEKIKVLECAAALHDVGVQQSVAVFGSARGRYHESLGAKIAGELLDSLDFPGPLTDRILFLIGHHHSPDADSGVLLRVLFEAEAIAELQETVGKDSCVPKKMLDTVITTKTGKDILKTRYAIAPELPLRTL